MNNKLHFDEMLKYARQICKWDFYSASLLASSVVDRGFWALIQLSLLF